MEEIKGKVQTTGDAEPQQHLGLHPFISLNAHPWDRSLGRCLRASCFAAGRFTVCSFQSPVPKPLLQSRSLTQDEPHPSSSQLGRTAKNKPIK